MMKVRVLSGYNEAPDVPRWPTGPDLRGGVR